LKNKKHFTVRLLCLANRNSNKSDLQIEFDKSLFKFAIRDT